MSLSKSSKSSGRRRISSESDSAEVDEVEVWVVIETTKEFCVVMESAIEQQEFCPGDQVTFRWSKQRILEGTVRLVDGYGRSGHSSARLSRIVQADYGNCTEEAGRLNRLSKVPTEGSFHAERPRKAAVSAKQSMRHSKQATNSEPAKKKARTDKDDIRARVEEDQILNEFNPAGSEIDDDLEELNETVPTADCEKASLIKKLLGDVDQETRASLVQMLGLSVNKEGSTQTQPKAAHPQASSTPRLPKPVDSVVSRQVTPHRVHGLNNSFTGDMYIFPVLQEGAVEVFDAGIFCCATAFARAENASSATMVARRLLEGVFTQTALLRCSVSGLPPRGKGKAAYTQDNSLIKPFLCPKGINAIVCQAVTWQKRKHFIKRKDDSQIRASMQVRMNELQKQHAAKQQVED